MLPAAAWRGTVTVVINNRNLVTWPKAMVDRIEHFSSLAEIIVVDNGSTYPPVLEWYSGLRHRVVRAANLGHRAPWSPEINREIHTDLYVVSDPDLDLAETPLDCLEHLARCLALFPQARKIGLGLAVSGIPPASPYFEHVASVERPVWELPLLGGLIRKAPVDTTFAIYHKKLMNEYRVTGARADAPYVARHIPWLVVEPDPEFSFYLARANDSSSYKRFVAARRLERNTAQPAVQVGRPDKR